jgi:hypothetical protein
VHRVVRWLGAHWPVLKKKIGRRRARGHFEILNYFLEAKSRAGHRSVFSISRRRGPFFFLLVVPRAARRAPPAPPRALQL